MGRKIKGRKHRGIRDPEKQRQARLLSIQDKINTAPSNPDEQAIPKSLSRLINLKEKIRDGSISIKRKRTHKKKRGPVTSHPYGIKQTNSDKPAPFFQQEKGESDRRFLWRVNQICQSVINESAFEDKYGVDVKRNAETYEVEGVAKRKKEKIIKDSKSQKKKGGKIEKVKLTKSQKRQIKLKQKKENRSELNIDEFKLFQDNVKFGEIVHEPPSLQAPKKGISEEVPRPGKKDLLLKTLINGNISRTGPIKKEDKLKKVSNKVIDRKGKRKDLPHALRRRLDKQQQEVIEAYKKLKAKRYKAG